MSYGLNCILGSKVSVSSESGTSSEVQELQAQLDVLSIPRERVEASLRNPSRDDLV